MTPVQRLARGVVLELLAHMRHGEFTLLEGTRLRRFGSGAPHATVNVGSPRAWPMLLHGSRGLAEAYMDGLWNSPDLTAVVRLAARNMLGFDRWRRRVAPLRVPLQAARGMRLRNTPARSRGQIASHYDLGNEFFALMLDETMSYSCAYFPHGGLSLAEASRRKLELVCSKLELGERDHVLEIGGGWGSFAIHAARTRGCRVTTTTISREQHELMCARVREAGVQDRVTVLRDDYRALCGRFDALASIEMIEAVGWRDFGTFFQCCSRRLRDDGRMLLQAIVIDDRAYEVEKASRSFVRTHIFPNGCLPSLAVIGRELARRTDMRTLGLQELTPHYPETLRRWRANFEAARAGLQALGYDERFRRMWRLYLSYCEAGFTERRIRLVQMLLAKPRFGPPAGGQARRERKLSLAL